MTKRYYLTTDNLNAAAAETHADRCGLSLEVVDLRDLSRLARERADVVLDWDYLPEEVRAQLLDGATVKIVAVHGYNLGDGLASFLRRQGIHCGRRFDQSFFDALARRASAA